METKFANTPKAVQHKPKAGEGETFEIHLTIAGKSFPMTVERKKEELYRRAEKEINQLTVEFSKRFRYFQAEDHLAMAAIVVAVSKAETEMKRSLEDNLGQLVEIDSVIDEYFSSIE